MISEHLQQRLAELPAKPGVYLMKDARDKIIYIGKARILRNRVRSYFVEKKNTTHKAALLLQSRVHDIEWILTESELEALLLEANLVQKHQPRYNVRLKDDKHYPYIQVTTAEPFPRVRIVRKVYKDGNRYFGPYTNVKPIRRLVENIPKWFQIRECKLKLPKEKLERPCLNYQIKRCDAPCVDYCSQEDYQKQVRRLLQFLEGKDDLLFKELQEDMQRLAGEQQFEQAARVRDQLQGLQAVRERQGVDLSDAGLAMDLVGFARQEKEACLVLMTIREGILLDRKHFPLRCEAEEENPIILEQFLSRYYKDGINIPDEVVLSEEVAEPQLLQNLLSELKGKQVPLYVPQRGKKKSTLNLAVANAEMLLVEQSAKTQAYSDRDKSIFALQKILGLKKPPRRIEGFDISHLGGTLTVASMVSFWNGRPDKKEYRHFRVKTVEYIDDFASMHEVVGRRYKRLLDEEAELPDLLLIDGGKGQVGMVIRSLEELGLEKKIPLIGIAKREEELIVPWMNKTVLLSRRSPELKMLQHIRNEAHRFAITFQRNSRKQHLQIQWLDIPGIGPASRKKIIQLFSTPEELLASEPKVLERLIGKSKAELVRQELEKKRQV
jgi:excinuclease ABC subunit C